MRWVFSIWFPHSGGRLLNRNLMPLFDKIVFREIFNPLLHLSTDDILRLDSTEQVHKHRSIEPLRDQFELVSESVQHARIEGLKYYFESFLRTNGPADIIGGALPCGARFATFDFKLIKQLLPESKFIHLVRDPVTIFPSFAKRYEIDGDPHRMMHEWSRFNSRVHSLISETDIQVIRYEDLIESPAETVQTIASFLEVDVPDLPEDILKTRHGLNTGSVGTDHEVEIGLLSDSPIFSAERRRYRY